MSIEELEQKEATTGLVLELDDVAAAEKIQPNATPQGLDRLSYKAEEHIKTISNISDSMQGFDREDVAAKAIQAKQSRGSINMTKVMDNLERSDFLVARNVLDIVQEYYTEPRLLHITHDDLLQQPETLEVNTYDEALNEITNDLTIGEYSIIITSQPFRATLEDSQFEQGMAMREAGIQLPDDILIENSRLQRKSEIVKRLQAAQNSPEAQQKAQLEMRNMEAAVAVAEAEAQQKAADAQLKLAKTKSEIASIEQENARITLEAKFVDAEGGGAAEAAKMQVEGQKAGHKMDLEERQFQHKQSLAEREMALKEEGHAREQARADDMHEHQKVISSKQADAQAQATRQAALSAAFNQGESE
jgi:hypothetical protein